jgi:hypothetical protein
MEDNNPIGQEENKKQQRMRKHGGNKAEQIETGSYYTWPGDAWYDPEGQRKQRV